MIGIPLGANLAFTDVNVLGRFEKSGVILKLFWGNHVCCQTCFQGFPSPYSWRTYTGSFLSFPIDFTSRMRNIRALTLSFDIMSLQVSLFFFFFWVISFNFMMTCVNILFVVCMTERLSIFGELLVWSNIFKGWFLIFFRIKWFLAAYFSISSMNSISSYLFMWIFFCELRFFDILSFIRAMWWWSVGWSTNNSCFIMNWKIFCWRGSRSSKRGRMIFWFWIRRVSINQFPILIYW